MQELVKQDCNTPAFDNLKEFVNGNECQMQQENMQCAPGHLDRIYRSINTSKKYVAVLEAEIEQINKIDFRKNNLEKDINKAKDYINSYNNLQKLERENNLARYRQIIEDVKKAQNKVNDCPHFQILRYFNKMKQISIVEKYSLINMILQKFQDIQPGFLKEL